MFESLEATLGEAQLKFFNQPELKELSDACPAVIASLAEEETKALAEVAAAKGGVLSGADISVAVHAAFVAVPGQTCTRSSLVGKQQGAAFLAALPAPWTTLLAPARAACQAAVVAAGTARQAADAAAAAAVADHQPPAAPSVVAAGAVTAATVDVASMVFFCQTNAELELDVELEDRL